MQGKKGSKWVFICTTCLRVLRVGTAWDLLPDRPEMGTGTAERSVATAEKVMMVCQQAEQLGLYAAEHSASYGAEQFVTDCGGVTSALVRLSQAAFSAGVPCTFSAKAIPGGWEFTAKRIA